MALYNSNYARDAVQVNGLFIEDLIPGHFYTLTSLGRETITKEIVNSEYKRDGSIREYSRYPERTIHVEYIISGDTAEDFRNNCNQLMNLLNVENADIQFNDEIDKFFKGTISVGEIEEKYGTWALGSYDIICEDPYKYSITVKEATGVVSGNTATFSIYYGGNQPSRPVLCASFGSGVSSGEYTDDDDCGFVAFYDSNGNIIQLGNPDAENLDSSSKARLIYNASWDNITMPDFQTKWALGGQGSWLKRGFTDEDFNRGAGWSHQLLTSVNFGSDTTMDEHGPEWTLTDANGFQNFTANFIGRIYSMDTTNDRGTLKLFIKSNDNKATGITIMKTDSSATAVVGYWVDGVIRGSARMDVSQYNEHMGWTKKTGVYKFVGSKRYNNTTWYPSDSGTNEFLVYTRQLNRYEYTTVNGNIFIQKRGNTYKFKVGNLPLFTYTYSRSDGSTIVFDKSFITMKANKAFPTMNMGLQMIRLMADPGAHFSDQKNVFSGGDAIEADCNSASIQLFGLNSTEGRSAPEYGALGNDWETFLLQPGTNTIQATWSDWVSTPPLLKIKYNEKFL